MTTDQAAAHLEADLRAAARRARVHRRDHDREGLRAGWRQRTREMFVPLCIRPDMHKLTSAKRSA